MGGWKSVVELRDGQSVDAETLNKPLSELADRTTYLKEEIDAIGSRGQLSSVRAIVGLSDDDAVPGDIVCIDSGTGMFSRALSSMSVFDAYEARMPLYAVGMLVRRETDGRGVVAFSGEVDLSEFDVPGMLEDGDVCRNGPYFLSSRNPGKISSSPHGVVVQIGVFVVNPQKSGRETWDRAYLNVQYGDLLSHRHMTYRLSAKPAGVPVYDAEETESELGTVVVLGYPSDGVAAGVGQGEDGSFIPFLRVSGEWHSRYPSTYTIWLSRNAGGGDRESSPAPSSDFSDAWLHWESSDPNEGSGEARVSSFYQRVAIGKKGLAAELDAGFSDELSTPYSVENDDPSLRTWTLELPEAAKGWSSNSVSSAGRLGDSEVRVYGVTDGRSDEVCVHAPDGIYELPDELPSQGERLVVGSKTYVFVNGSGTYSVADGEVAVPIQATPYDTFRGIAHPIDDDGTTIVSDEAAGAVFIGASSVSYRGVSLDPVSHGGGTVSADSGEAALIVCDELGRSLYDGGYVVFGRLGHAVSLNNGGRMFLSADGEVSIPVSYAVLDVSTGSPGAVFRYNIEMDEDFNLEYPPVPIGSGSLMWNGVELEPEGLFGKTAVYSAASDSLYWRDNVLYRTPWPRSLVDSSDPVDPAHEQRLVFHYVSSFHSETGPVVSLRPAKGSPIVVRRCGTTESASVGDLELDADLLADVFDSDERGYKAVKASRNGKLLLGPLVERIVAGPGIELQQTIDQPTGQGVVTIAATNSSYSGEMDTIALENAKEEMVGMFPYIRLLGWDDGGSNIPTGFVAKFQVPTGIVDDVYRVRLYATVFGEESFSGSSGKQVAGVSMNYSILPDWTPVSGTGVETASLNLKSDLISCDSPVSADIPFGVGADGSFSYKAFDPILVHNDPSIEDVDGRSSRALGDPLPSGSECESYLASHLIGTSSFGVRPGYIVSVKFSRSAPSSGTPYTGRLGFINLRWSLVSTSSDGVVASRDQSDAIDPKSVIAKMRGIARIYNSGNTRTAEQVRSALLTLLSQLR